MAMANAERTEIQIKTFTRWSNTYLTKRGLEVKELKTDFSDGLNLINLLELLSNEAMSKYNKTPKIEIQKLENLNTALKFITDHKVQIVNIGSKDIFGGNEKLILGLLWTLILRWEVSEEGKNGLLLWVQRSCKGYSHIDPPNVQNFTLSWCNGLAFCAIINKYRPDLLDYSSLSPNNGLANCELAFKVAEEKLGIARLLDASDVVGQPDEKSIIAYVSQFFKLFAQSQQNAVLLRSIKTACEVTKKHDNWITAYQDNAAVVADWTQAQTSRLSQKDTSNTTAQVKQNLDSFQKYMKAEKLEFQNKLSEIEGNYSTLVISKKNNKRPDFNPALALVEIQTNWEQLQQMESNYERAMLDKFMQFKKVDANVARFNARTQSLEQWIEQNMAVFKAGKLGSSLTEIESNLDVHDSYEKRLEQVKPIIDGLHESHMQIEALSAGEHKDAAAVGVKMDEVDKKLAALTAAGDEHRIKLQQALEKEKSMIASRRAFAKAFEELVFDIDVLDQVVNERVEVASAADIGALSNIVTGLRQQLSSCETKATEVASIASAAGSADFSKSAQQQQTRLQGLGGKINDKEKELKSILAVEEEKERLRNAFADKANKFAHECENKKSKLGASTGTLQQQLEAVRTTRAAVEGQYELLKELQSLSDECDKAQVIANPYTSHTIHTLKAMLDQIKKTADAQENSINSQILANSALEITPEQLKEFTDVFKYFDADNTGSISVDELIEAVKGAGMDLPEEEVRKKMAAKRPTMKFNSDDFTAFMVEETRKGDGIDDVKSAFKQLAGGAAELPVEKVQDILKTEPELCTYIVEKMPDGNYSRFTDELFSI